MCDSTLYEANFLRVRKNHGPSKILSLLGRTHPAAALLASTKDADASAQTRFRLLYSTCLNLSQRPYVQIYANRIHKYTTPFYETGI